MNRSGAPCESGRAIQCCTVAALDEYSPESPSLPTPPRQPWQVNQLRTSILNHLRFLHYLDEVARIGSIRRAAQRLHVAPSAVNRRIQDLEAELGAPLFERLPRGMRLTAAGELFVHYIRSRAAHLEQVRSEIEDLQGLRRGCVRIVVSQAAAATFLPERIAGFKKKHPLVEFRVQVGDHSRALDSLRTFESDLALIFHLTPEADIARLDEVVQPLCLM